MIKGLGTTLLLAALFAAYVLLANPWNWFMPHSDKFDWQEFAKIEAGDNLASVVDRLGKPTYVTSFHGLQLKCSDCTAVYFAGPAPSWLASYREARLIVDSSGIVVNARIHREP